MTIPPWLMAAAGSDQLEEQTRAVQWISAALEKQRPSEIARCPLPPQHRGRRGCQKKAEVEKAARRVEDIMPRVTGTTSASGLSVFTSSDNSATFAVSGAGNLSASPIGTSAFCYLPNLAEIKNARHLAKRIRTIALGTESTLSGEEHP
ncbi:hypothetical protein HPB50_005324 [Hyalomma asiaticum]|uniref:Uncharacterized protein n=1 Tax=Hyalomma asiaticum TaxID=266040 RepID=A0ACB7RSK1_HYAAI|nr:hypothetical protein HPB50_005324 [Hyalomma asiaticum]